MVRDVKGSTIISYHHGLDGCTTSAEDLFTRLKLVGRSVYWRVTHLRIYITSIIKYRRLILWSYSGS